MPPEQHELRTRVQGERRVGERDGLLPVSRGEGRVQHGVGGAALGMRGDDGVRRGLQRRADAPVLVLRRLGEGERRVRAQPVPRGGAERCDVVGDGQHGDGDGVVRERSGRGLRARVRR